MAERDLYCSGDCSILPEEITESLRKYGGVEGLLKLIPEDKVLFAEQSVHQALSDSTRLRIISLLNIRPLCVCVIKAALLMGDSRLSYHLSVLKKAGLVKGEQQGNWIIYSLTEKGKKWA